MEVPAELASKQDVNEEEKEEEKRGAEGVKVETEEEGDEEEEQGELAEIRSEGRARITLDGRQSEAQEDEEEEEAVVQLLKLIWKKTRNTYL